MITLNVKDEDWSVAKDHWVALKEQLTDKESIAKAEFVDDVVFNTAVTTAEIDLPSLLILTQIMNEIDNEIKMDESNELESSEELKLDENIKKFVCAPVK